MIGRRASRADLAAATLAGRASERNHAKGGDRRCQSELSLSGELCFRVGHRRRSRDDVNALPLRTRPARVRAHSRMSPIRVERRGEGLGCISLAAVPGSRRANSAPPGQFIWPLARPSAGNHAHENAIPAHEVMIDRRADMGSHKASNGNADEAMEEEKLLGECAVLAPDRRQLEPAEDDGGRAIGRSGNPSRERLYDEKRVESRVRGVRGELLDRRNVIGSAVADASNDR